VTNILDSAWLIKMLKKSGNTPQIRLLSLFDILADWADAPKIRESLLVENSATPDHLLNYLTEEARACGAQLPEALAQQLYFIALSALQESLRTADNANFSHAKLAAKALIIAQTEKESLLKNKPWLYSVAASFFAIVIVGGLLLYNQMQRPMIAPNNLTSAIDLQPPTITQDSGASPKNTAEMYASIEQMRQGDCQYPEALTIPDAHKKVYLENVVGGQVPESAQDQALALSYIKKIRCNYTPMLMKNSVN
jgi:hypothetical protein